MKKRVMMTTAGLVFLAACAMDAAQQPEGSSYLLLDADAQAAGLAVQLDDVDFSSVLPMRLAAGQAARLVGPGSATTFAVGANELLFVHGDGSIERLDLADIERDRLEIGGDAAAIADFADELGASLDEGAYEDEAVLILPSLLEVLSEQSAPIGLRELRPVVRTDADAEAVVTIDPPMAPENVLASAAALVNPIMATPTAAESGLVASVSGCTDPALGTWVSRQYSPWHGGYYEFTLNVRADGAHGLRGEILSHFWVGSALSEDGPATCDPDVGEEWVVHMPAVGRRDGNRFSFRGTSFSVREATCGQTPTSGDYNLDRFSGELTMDGDGIKTVNNDGGVFIDVPTAFTRISC